MPGRGARKGKVAVEKTKEIGQLYQSGKRTKGGDGSTSTTTGRPRGRVGRAKRMAACSRPVVPPSPLPPVESDGEQQEEEQEEEQEQEEEEEEVSQFVRQEWQGDEDNMEEETQFVCEEPQSSGSEEEVEEDEGEVEVVFEESDDEILALPRKEKVFLRGPATLPDLPYAARNFTLIPAGKTAFIVDGVLKPPRTYSSILGCLLRKHFPGLVKLSDGTKVVAWSWNDYFLKKDVTDKFGKKYDTVAHRVLCLFWKYFTQADGTREKGMSVVVELCKKLVKEMHYDARVNCVINWYAEYRKVSLPKEKARQKHMKAWQYLQVPPQWCVAKKRCFRVMVAWWTSEEYKRIHKNASDRRKLMGGAPHRQGNICLANVVKKKERETGEPVSLFRAFCETRQRDEPDAKLGLWLTAGHKLRGDKYTSMFKAKNGKDSDPLNEPFDPEVAVRAGEGRTNGRLWIGDGSVDPSTIPSLSKVRASRLSSKLGIETRPKPSLVLFSEIQARLDEETRKREEAEHREQQMHATLAQQQKMMDQQQEMLTQMAERFTAYDSHIVGTSGVPPLGCLPPLPPVSKVMVPPLTGFNNVTPGPSPNQHESQVVPITSSQPPNQHES